ncbi:MAG TPA: hypothetical protein VIF32_07475 [Gemmatimonadaceae bacterium]|jgi:ABC-type transport system involved in multi-copper enzyme maturation permease subunit
MSPTIDKRRAKLADYVPWIARDYLTNQGPSTAIIIVLLALFEAQMFHVGTGTRLADMPLDIAARLLRGLVSVLAFLGTFFATNGIVSNDRKAGYYRFLFAKPVSPPWYYATVFGVYGIGLLTVVLVLLGVWAIAVRPLFPLEIFGAVLVLYLAYGGIGFLLSAAWRFDWLSLVTVLLVARLLWTLWGNATGIRHWLLYLLPPIHRADNVADIVMRGAQTPVPWSLIAWLGGYGLVCFVLGLVVLRKRPLGTS